MANTTRGDAVAQMQVSDYDSDQPACFRPKRR